MAKPAARAALLSFSIPITHQPARPGVSSKLEFQAGATAYDPAPRSPLTWVKHRYRIRPICGAIVAGWAAIPAKNRDQPVSQCSRPPRMLPLKKYVPLALALG
jgi:hypothetical protein